MFFITTVMDDTRRARRLGAPHRTAADDFRRRAEVVTPYELSALLSLIHIYGMNTDKLYVKEVHVGPGPIMKRVMPRAQGRAFRILKRTSHVTLSLIHI